MFPGLLDASRPGEGYAPRRDGRPLLPGTVSDAYYAGRPEGSAATIIQQFRKHFAVNDLYCRADLSYRSRMTRDSIGRTRRPVLFSFKFVGTALVGSLTMALVSTFAPLPAQLAVLGAGVSILAGLFLSYLEQEEHREERRAELLEKLEIPIALAPEHDLFDQYRNFAEALAGLAEQRDPVLREFALLKLASVTEQVRSLAQGKVVFTGTETWRTVYERILESPGLREYHSVAWVKTRDYWQDPPGRQSMRLNYELAGRGLRIERIVILRGGLWPAGEPLPSEDIRPWLEEQHNRGIWLLLVRESSVGSEPDLLADFAIYGDRATGVQELDEQSRTLRFILAFDPQSVRLFRDRWERLCLYATPYGDLLEQAGRAPDPR